MADPTDSTTTPDSTPAETPDTTTLTRQNATTISFSGFTMTFTHSTVGSAALLRCPCHDGDDDPGAIEPPTPSDDATRQAVGALLVQMGQAFLKKGASAEQAAPSGDAPAATAPST